MRFDAAINTGTSRPIALENPGGGVFNTNGSDVEWSSVVSGTGSVTKTGAGTLTLDANNTYTGATTVNAGTLPNDFDGGAIGQAQYDTWKANFGAALPAPGAGSGPGSNSAVPQPASLVLLLLASAGSCLKRSGSPRRGSETR